MDRRSSPRSPSAPLKGLAILHVAFALAGLAAGLSMCVSFWLIPGRFSDIVLGFAFPLFLFLAIFLFLPGLAGGIAVLLGRAWGRIVLFLLSALMLVVVPIGTLLGGVGIWILLADKGAPPVEGARLARQGRPITRAYVAATVVLLVAFAAAGVIVLQAVFRFREQTAPDAIAQLFGAATIALPVALTLAVLIVASARTRPGQPRD